MHPPHLAPIASSPGARLSSLRPFGHLHAFRHDTLNTLMRAMAVGDVTQLRFVRRPVWVVSSPQAAEEVLLDRDGMFRKSSGLRVFAQPILGRGILVSEGALHRGRRAAVAPSFLPKHLPGYAGTMLRELDRHLDDLCCRERVDLGHEMTALTLRIAAATLFTAEVEDDVVAIGSAMARANDAIMRLVRSPLPLPPHIPTPAARQLHAAAAVLDPIVMRLIHSRRASGEASTDVLTRLLAAVDPETGEPLSDRALRDEVMTLLLAGHETTANALTWTLALLAQHPEACEQLHAEAERVLSGRPPAPEDLPALPFARQVVHEGLRLYPPAYVISRSVKADGAVQGARLATGQLLFVNVWGIHRREAAFPEASAFRPERFADGAERDWPRGTYLPFGLGPRTCVGNHFALMELQLVLVRMAQRLHLAGAIEPPVTPAPGVTLRPSKAMGLRVSPR